MASFDTIDDYNDWQKLKDKRKRDRVERKRPVLEEAAQAAVHSSRLTGDKMWDVFLQQVQAKIDATQQMIDVVTVDFFTATTMTSNELRECREAGIKLRARVLSLTEVIQMPYEILNAGEDARGQLGSLDHDAEDAAS